MNVTGEGVSLRSVAALDAAAWAVGPENCKGGSWCIAAHTSSALHSRHPTCPQQDSCLAGVLCCSNPSRKEDAGGQTVKAAFLVPRGALVYHGFGFNLNWACTGVDAAAGLITMFKAALQVPDADSIGAAHPPIQLGWIRR